MILTEEIAFNLGAFKYPCFYDMAHLNEEFECKEFFKPVSAECFLYNVNIETGERVKDILGELDDTYFNSHSLKLAYLKGALSKNGSIKDNRIKIQYANSYKSRDRFAKWFGEIMSGYSFAMKLYEWWRTVPGTPGIEIKAEEKIIKMLEE